MTLDPIELLRQLIQIPSVNPMGRDVFGPPFGEQRLTEFLQDQCERLGLPWLRQRVHPGRDNLLALLRGCPTPKEGGELLLWEVHQDTVPVEGMTIEPFGGDVREGRLYGRGACDVKGGMATMLAAISRVVSAKPQATKSPTIVLAFTVNEECGYTGARALRNLWPHRGSSAESVVGTITPSELFPKTPDAAIVAEPTSFQVVVAHHGIVRWRCRTIGRAAHTSRPANGINAIYGMAQIVQTIERLHAALQQGARSHPLCGSPCACVSVINGGVGVNTVPECATIEVERRLGPAEEPSDAYHELIEYITANANVGQCRTEYEPPFLESRGLNDNANRAFGERLLRLVRENHAGCELVGVPYGTDAPAIASEGVPTVVFGPGSIDQAHTADEFIKIEELELGADIFFQIATDGLSSKLNCQPTMPIHDYSLTHEHVSRDERLSDETSLLAPMWNPDDAAVKRSNIAAAMRDMSFDAYEQLYRWSITQPTEFWSRVLDTLQIRFARPPREILANGQTGVEAAWLPGARLNIVESCFQAAPGCNAILCGRENGEISKVTYRELRNEVNRVANGLRRLGVEPGDGVALFMPMNARSVAIYLGIILAGCVVISIADSFSREQVLLRLRISNAKVVFTAGFVQRGEKEIPLYARVAGAGLPAILTDDAAPTNLTLEAADMPWTSFCGSDSFNDVVHADPTAPINVLFSSGTTGEPKAIPWDHITPIRSASDGHFHQDIHPGDVVAWPTNFGWMMGPWLTFATLINRGTIALFDGASWGEAFGRFVQDAAVNILGVIPSTVCRWRQMRSMEGLDWAAIRLFTSTGECSNPSDMRYLSQLAGGKPVIEYCGGTELGGGYISSTVVQPNIPSTFSTPVLGTELVILGDSDLPSAIGEVYLVHPALGMSRRLLNGDHSEVYFRGTPPGPHGKVLRRHGDQLELLPNGYYRALGRTDDAINLGGIKVGSAEIERVILELSDISEVAVIGVPGADGGPNRLVACIGVSNEERPDESQLRMRIQEVISEKLNPLFKLHDVFICAQLPRTASNKVMRRELRRMYEQES